MADLEGVLFLGREPLSSRKLARLAGLADGTEARTLIRRLNASYDAEGNAFRIEEVGGGYQLLTRPQYGGWLRRQQLLPSAERWSGPALETLSVVAYRQPVARAGVEAIRGVQCGEILRQLMERDLVRIVGRADELGRPFLYGTTKRFLQVFGLRSLDDLPRAAQLRAGTAAGGGMVVSNDATCGDHRSEDHQGMLSVSSEEREVSTAIVDDPTETPWTRELDPVRLAKEVRRDDDDDDLDDDEDDDDDDDDEEDDLEEDEWEEVEDSDEEESDDDEEDEDEDWDEEEDEDWEDEDEDDWDDDDEDEDEEWEEEQ